MAAWTTGAADTGWWNDVSEDEHVGDPREAWWRARLTVRWGERRWTLRWRMRGLRRRGMRILEIDRDPKPDP